MATDDTAELSIIEKCAVDALLAAQARFADHSPFGAEGLAAFARALQSMSWKVVGHSSDRKRSAVERRSRRADSPDVRDG